MARMKVLDIVATPNPNAIKVLLDGPVSAGTQSYFNATAAVGDALATGLFAIPGVAGIMLLGTFVTVSKRKEAAWDAILPAVKAVLEAWTQKPTL